MLDLDAFAWSALILGAALVGFSKTAVPGVNILSVVLFAAALPARLSTGALLLVMLVGDAFGVWTYRRNADWPTLWRLVPAVLAGLLSGAIFLALVQDDIARRMIGTILLLLLGLTAWRRTRRRSGHDRNPPPRSRLAAVGFGSLGGFTTMVANAGGPALSLYFLAARFPVERFLGTTAWFFATMNVIKLPVSVGLGLVPISVVATDATLVPAVALGALIGRRTVRRLHQQVFDRAVLIFTALGAAYLLL